MGVASALGGSISLSGGHGIAIELGMELNMLLEYFGVILPIFMTCLFAGIVLTNTIPVAFKKMTWPTAQQRWRCSLI